MLELFSIIGAMSFFILGVGYLRAQPKSRHAQIYFFLSICIVFYFLNALSFVWIQPPFRIDFGPLNFILNWIPSAVPGLFMLFCFSLFEETKKIPSWLLGIVISHLLVLGGWLIYLNNFDLAVLNRVFIHFFAGLLDFWLLAFALGALFWTVKEWRNDLVERRRGLRTLFVLLLGIIMLIVVVSENYVAKTDAAFKLSQQFSVTLAAISGFVVVLALMTFDFNMANHILSLVANEQSGKENSTVVNTEELDAFERIFVSQHLYHQNDLTFAKVAKAIGLPEYRARKFIIDSLGFRNFNTMLNHFRVKDACAYLADPEKNDVPILTIALELGYNSINPFNAAFRALQGVTPSEYRKQAQPSLKKV